MQARWERRREFFKAWSDTTQQEADRIIGICMDAGLNFFDTADVYSNGSSEEALGKSLKATSARMF